MTLGQQSVVSHNLRVFLKTHLKVLKQLSRFHGTSKFISVDRKRELTVSVITIRLGKPRTLSKKFSQRLSPTLFRQLPSSMTLFSLTDTPRSPWETRCPFLCICSLYSGDCYVRSIILGVKFYIILFFL